MTLKKTETIGTDLQDQQVIQEVQRIVSAIVHDFGAPLRGVVSFSQLLMDHFSEALDEQTQRWLDYIHADGAKAQTMLASLQQYSQLLTEQDKQEELDLSQLAEQLLRANKSFITEKTAQVRVGTLPKIIGVRTHWYQLLNHLLSNALIYQPEDSTPKVQISAILEGDRWTLTVEDNGVGVDPSNYDKLSLPFKRFQSEDQYPGMGMGLCFCERIIRLQHGQMEFAQAEAKGLKVSCHLPAGSLIAPLEMETLSGQSSNR